MEKYDVLIVGGSCAGAAAGHVLAKSGKKVAIIDKAVFPRNKLCGGMITEKTIKILKEIYGSESLETIINSRFNTYGIYHSELGKICKFTDPSSNLYFVDRAIFDNHFLTKAELAGCNLILGKKVVAIEDKYIITDSGEKISADYILGADGSYSIVHKEIFHDKSNKEAAIAVEVDIGYEDLKCFNNSDDVFPRIYFGYINGGYGWIFPKREFATVGLGGTISLNKNIRNLFLIFLKDVLSVDIEKVSSKIVGFPVPFQNLIETPAKGTFFLLGDAAGFIEPITGEGIFFAILSGKLAAEAIINSTDSVKSYNESVRKNIIRLLNQAQFAKYFFFDHMQYAMHKMKNNAKYCKYYFDLLSGEVDYIKYAFRVLMDRGKYKSE